LLLVVAVAAKEIQFLLRLLALEVLEVLELELDCQ
jgi:hypothetical protein